MKFYESKTNHNLKNKMQTLNIVKESTLHE